LTDMGNWLNINGEAIYATKSLKKYKEGDFVKYTVSKDDKFIYAIVVKKTDQPIVLKNIQVKAGSKIKMLGVKKGISHQHDAREGTLTLNWPKELPCDHAWVFKIEGASKN